GSMATDQPHQVPTADVLVSIALVGVEVGESEDVSRLMIDDLVSPVPHILSVGDRRTDHAATGGHLPRPVIDIGRGETDPRSIPCWHDQHRVVLGEVDVLFGQANRLTDIGHMLVPTNPTS